MSEAFNRRELPLILSDLLAADRAAMCERLLSRFDTAMLDILDAALDDASVTENAAVKTAKAYRLILKKTYAVGNSATLFENMGYMLYDHRSEMDFTPEEQERIADIVRSESFYTARREVVEFYGRAVRYGAPLVASTTRILVQYIIAAPGDFLDPARLAALLGEYRETISFGDLGTMRALLAAWLLKTSKDAAVIDFVLDELTAIPAVAPLAARPTVAEAPQLGAAILAHLTQNDRVRLRSVVYRTESSRRMLDRILRL